MEEVSNQNIGQLPIPAVEGVKRYLAEESVSLARAAQEVDDLDVKYSLELLAVNSTDETKTRINSEKSAAAFMFYSKAKLIMRSLEPHLAAEDILSYREYWRLLENRNNPKLYDIDSIDELNSFIQQALKNSNLLELGQKSHIKEIINEINISNL
jgi:hypothetical protein